jgi:gas vesicle structural protein
VTTQTSGTGLVERPRPSGLADVLDTVLDKGMVIDAYVRVSLVGIELLTVDARIVVASVDTYLRFAEAVNRLDLAQQQKDLPELVDDLQEGGAKSKTKGALEGAREKVGQLVGGRDEDDEDEDEADYDDTDEDEEDEREPARSSRRGGRGKR